MAHFLQGMAAQLFLLVIFTQKSDALVFGFLLFAFLTIRWAFLNRDFLKEQKKDTPPSIYVPENLNSSSKLASTSSSPVIMKHGST